jgi:RNA binding exosome subunit
MKFLFIYVRKDNSSNLKKILEKLSRLFPDQDITNELKEIRNEVSDVKSDLEQFQKKAAYLVEDKPEKGDKSLVVRGEIISTKAKS